MIVWFMFSVCFLFKKISEKNFEFVDYCLKVLLLQCVWQLLSLNKCIYYFEQLLNVISQV